MIVLATATRMEMDAVLAGFCPPERAPEERTWRLLDSGGQRLCLLVTGIGPVNAALSLGALLGSGQGVAGVCNLGVSGSFDIERFPLGSVALPGMEICPEFGLRTEQGTDPAGLKLAQAAAGMRGQQGPVFDRLRLCPRADAAVMGLALPKEFPEAVSLSVSGVTGTTRLAGELQMRYLAQLENMEGFALAYAAFAYGLPFVAVRSVSNRVGSRKPADWRLKQALERLGTVASRLFSGLES